MDAATVLNACGTAYAIRYIRANIQGGIEIGFDAAQLLSLPRKPLKEPRSCCCKKHTHPEQRNRQGNHSKGCTIAGLNGNGAWGFGSSLIKRRGNELQEDRE